MSAKKQVVRDSNIELLRIILILMIIALHYLDHGGALNALSPSFFNYYIANALESLFIVAVDCFILITGYYQINGQFKIKKLLNLWTTILFYSFTISIIFWYLQLENFTIVQFVKSLFPLITRRWWFLTVYVSLYLLSPYLNIALNNMNKKQHEKLLVIELLLFVILPSFLPGNYPFNQENGYSLYNFTFLYCVGAYIRKYDLPLKRKQDYMLIYITCSLLIFIGRIIGGVASLYLGFTNNLIFLHYVSCQVLNYNFILIEIGAISLFGFFKDLKIVNNKINLIAASVLEIYVIHEHPYIRNILYTRIIHCADYYHTSFFALHLFSSILIIFAFCFIIEYLRKKLLASILRYKSIFFN